MSRILIAALLFIGSMPAVSCPTFDVEKRFDIDRSVPLSFKAVDGYEAHIMEDNPSVALPSGGSAYREDLVEGDIRHVLYPEIDGDIREMEVVLQVPGQYRDCMAEYEQAAREVLASLSF